jgi:hypothetical protein
MVRKIDGGHQVYFHFTLVQKYLATTILIFLLERKKLNEKHLWWPLCVGFFQPKKNEKNLTATNFFASNLSEKTYG